MPKIFTLFSAVAAFTALFPASVIAADYESSVSGTKDAASGITSITIPTGKTEESLAVSTTERHFFVDESLPVIVDDVVRPAVVYSGDATQLKFYVDVNQDGVFSPDDEMLSTAGADGAFAEFTLPEGSTASVYRCRVEADDCVVDFLMNYHNRFGNVTARVMHGYAMGASGAQLKPTATFGRRYTVCVVPAVEGFVAENAVVRHGQNVDGPQYIKGNRQWTEIELEPEVDFRIQPSEVDGDLLIIADFVEAEDSEWTFIWGDEFDGDVMDETKWSIQQRGSSTWNRFVARGNETPYVNKFGNGCYDSYCIATPEEFSGETNDMISGAINSAGKFYFTGGRIEARLRTTPHSGNFPAFWMMPQNGTGGWPVCGEIDIWEQINTENVSYHTIHSGWTYRSFGDVSKWSPAKGGTGTSDQTEWHVYALEWTQEELKWYVDNKHVFTYQNSHFSEGAYTEDVTWPFNKAFYVILNQSVGDGGWAYKPDLEFVYHTAFDYVRVYQRKDALDYYSTEKGTVGIQDVTLDGGADLDAPVEYYDLQGRKVGDDNLAKGIYIRKQGSNVTKILVK